MPEAFTSRFESTKQLKLCFHALLNEEAPEVKLALV
jgi:hypothetical protein